MVQAVNEAEQDEIAYKKQRIVKRTSGGQLSTVKEEEEDRFRQEQYERIENDCIRSLTVRLHKLEREQKQNLKYQSFNNKVSLILILCWVFLYFLIILNVHSLHQNTRDKYENVSKTVNNMADEFQTYFCCLNRKIISINYFLKFNYSSNCPNYQTSTDETILE